MARLVICAECGREKEHCAWGLCKDCYYRGHTQIASKLITCLGCGQQKNHHAKGMCGRCYGLHHRKNGGRFIVCPSCGQRKRHYAKGLCTSCYMVQWAEKDPGRHRRWYEEHIDYASEWQREWRKKHRSNVVASAARRRAREKELPCTLTAEQVQELRSMGQCFYCGATLSPKEVHLDHFVPILANGGTTRANMVASCAECNKRKGAKLPKECLAQLELDGMW